MDRRSVLIAALTILLALLIIIDSLGSLPTSGTRPAVSDKFGHALAYGTFLLPVAVFRPRWLLWLAPLGLVLSGMIESVQIIRGGYKVVSDLLGSGTGIIIVSFGTLKIHAIIALFRQQSFPEEGWPEKND